MPEKTVFISREIAPASVFAARLQAAGWAAYGRSLVTLSALPVLTLPTADWIFFSSRHAVRFFFDLPVVKNWISIEYANRPLPVRWAALGPGTADELLRKTGRVDFAGSGEPISAAAAFRPLAAGQRVLFPEARQSRQSVAALLDATSTAIHLPVYDNIPVAGLPPLDQRVLVFTSPMNAAAYLNQHPLKAGQRVVAIGAPTAEQLRDRGVERVCIAGEPTEAALAEAVLSIGP